MPVIASVAVAILVIFSSFFKIFYPPNVPTSSVLGNSSRGANEPYISIHDNEYSPNGGVISLSSTEEPIILIDTTIKSGQATIVTYESNINEVLSYLTHNKEYKQINSQPDISNKSPLNTQDFNLGEQVRLTLPLNPVGIYLVKITSQPKTVYAFIIRSNNGVVVKEGNDQLIFWGQDHTTHKSLSGGTATLYRLENQITSLQTAVFNEQGFATSNLLDNVDVAVYQKDNDISLIPINLTYLNTGFPGREFTQKNIPTKYFTFTDRPLYRPGDTVYFKAILRADDDAVYSIPNQSYDVEIFSGYGEEKETLYQKTMSLNSYGALDGQFALPKDVRLTYYTLAINPSNKPQNYWEGGNTGFQVAYFRKPEYTLSVTSGQKEIISGDELSYELSGEYFFGVPLKDMEVDYAIYSNSTGEWSYLPENTTTYTDYYGSYYGDETVLKGTVKLDDKGKAKLAVPTSANPKGENRIFSLMATVKDNSANPAMDIKNVLVYAGAYSIYRTDRYSSYQVQKPVTIPLKLLAHENTDLTTNLDIQVVRSEWIKKQNPEYKYDNYEKITENLPNLSTSINNQGLGNISFTPPKPGSYDLTLNGKDKRNNPIIKTLHLWVTTTEAVVYLSDYDEGITVTTDKESYEPEEIPQVTIQSSVLNADVLLTVERGYTRRYQVVSLTGNQVTIPFPLELNDMPNVYLGASTFATNFLARTQKEIKVSPSRREMQIKLQTDQPKYGPADTVTVNIQTTDRHGKGIPAEVTLWTIDKALYELADAGPGDIFDRFWADRYNFTLSAHSLESIMAISAEAGGGCFTSETLISMADNTKKPIKDIKPGDLITTFSDKYTQKTIQARVNQIHQAKVDGILVINNRLHLTPNHKLLVNSRWQEAGSIQLNDILLDESKNPLKVTSIYYQKGLQTVYNLEVDEYKTFIADGVYVHNQKGDVRQVFKDIPYWNPSIQTDSNGQATVRFTLPDNLTTWVIAAVGNDANTTVGRQTTDIIVSKLAIIRPNLPNFMRLGDKLDLTATAHNFSDQARQVNVILDFASAQISTPLSVLKNINSQESSVITYSLMPTLANPNAPFTISLKDPNDSKFVDIVKQTIPIIPYGYESKNSLAKIDGGNYQLDIPADVDKSQSKVKLSLGSSIIAPVIDALEYLVGYPYGCTEQTISSMLPSILAKQYKQYLPDSFDSKPIDSYIERGLKTLEPLQQSNGGFGWWKDSQPHPYITSFVAETLFLVKSQGHIVKPSIYNSLINSLKNYVNYPDPNTLKPDDLVAINYALSITSKNDAKPITNLESLTDDILALAVITNYNLGLTDANSNGLNLLISRAKDEPNGVYWQKGSREHYGSDMASTALALRALITTKADKALQQKAVSYLIRNRRHHYWYNTFATNQVVRSLLEYSLQNKEFDADLNYTITLNSKPVKQGTFTGFNPNPEIFELDLESLSPTNQLDIQVSGKGQLYSSLQSSLERTTKQSASISSGITLTRRYLVPEDNNKLEIGDLIIVELTVNGLNTTENYAVIRDVLPAGLIPVDRSFNNEYDWKQYAPNYQNRYNYAPMEINLDTINLQLYSINPGVQKYYYEARVMNKGEFNVPPAQIELMYDPTINASTEPQTLIIGDKLSGPTGEFVSLTPKLTFFQKYQRYLLPTTIALGVIVLSSLAYVIYRYKKHQKLTTIHHTPPYNSPPTV